MNKTLVSTLTLAAALFSSSAFAGYQYPPPPAPYGNGAASAAHEPTGSPYPPQYSTQAPVYDRCSPEDRVFFQSIHAMNVEEITLAELAMRKSGDPRVRDYAARVRDAQITLDEAIRRRGGDLGVTFADSRVYLGDLEYLRGPQFDVAYLLRSMDDHDRVRPSFAAYKDEQRGPWHRILQNNWNELVTLREIAKPLHDDIRNASRGYGYDDRDDGYGNGRGRGHGRHGRR